MKTVLSVVMSVLAIMGLIFLLWAAGTDAQGAIGLFIYAPVILLLAFGSAKWSKESVVRWVNYPLISVIVLFYVTAFFPMRYSPAQRMMKGIAKRFEKTTGLSPYMWSLQSDAKISDEVTVQGYRLTLADTSPCVLMTRRSTVRVGYVLSLDPPCTFHRAKDGTVRIKRVKDAQVLLVQSSRPDPQNAGACDTRLYGVLVTSDAVRVSKSFERVAACPPFHWDDKMFIGLAEQ